MMIVSASCENKIASQDGVQGTAETPSSQNGIVSPAFTTTSELLAPTQAPFSTLSPLRVKEEIQKLYFDNGGCKLPCFWGIDPGSSTLPEVHTRFSMLGEVLEEDYRWKNEHKLIPIKVSVPPEIDSFNEKEWTFYLVISNDIVESIIASSRHIEQTSVPTMSNILTSFGRPQEIWLAIMPHIPKYDADTAYEIALFYPSKGILVMGSGIAHILAETEKSVTVSICPHTIAESIDMDRHYPFSLHLWSPENKMSFTDLSYDDRVFEHGFFTILGSLESSINSEEFYETYKDPSVTECFELTQ
jgi:hypothetical protein